MSRISHLRQFRLDAVEKIPEFLLSAFQKETESEDKFMNFVRNSELKTCVFDGRRAVGFEASTPLIMDEEPDTPVLVGSGIYVLPQYQGRGIGTRLMHQRINNAEKMGLSGINMYEIDPGFEFMLEKMREEEWVREKSRIRLRITHNSDGTVDARIRFKKKRAGKN